MNENLVYFYKNEEIKVSSSVFLSYIHVKRVINTQTEKKIACVKTKTNTRVTPASDLYLADHVTRNGTLLEIQNGAELGWIQVIMIYLS